jgi:hypothetical protein
MRFDPQGDYVRKHVPEPAGLGPREIHEPWRLGRAPAPGSTTRRPSSTTPTRPRPSLPPGGRRVTCGRPPGGPRRRSEVTTRRRRDAYRARGACRSRRSRRVGGRRAGRGPAGREGVHGRAAARSPHDRW